MAAFKARSLWRRRVSAICFLVGGLMLGFGLLAPGADASSVGTASTSTSIVNNDNNKNCDEINADWTQLKIDKQPTNGPYTFGDVTITISNLVKGAHSIDFDWSATKGGDPYFFDAMILKVGASGYPVYFYDPPASSGHGTSPKDSISHLDFCNGAEGVTTTSGEETTTTKAEETTTTLGEGTTTTAVEETTTIPEETTTVPEETTTVPEETTTVPEATTTTAGEEATTTVSVEDTTLEQTTTTQGEEVVPTSDGETTTSEVVQAEVVTQPEALPRTGSNTMPLIAMGLGLILAGFGTLVLRREAFIRS